MKNRILKFSLTAFAAFLSISIAMAQDYSGRHYTDDSSSSSGLGFLVIIALVVGGFIIYGMIESNKNQKVSNTNNPLSSSSYTPPTREQIQKQQADHWQSQLDYLKQKDKEGDAALKGCGWTIVTIAVLALISYCSNH